jgi:uncharacterized lipoprotein YbaY
MYTLEIIVFFFAAIYFIQAKGKFRLAHDDIFSLFVCLTYQDATGPLSDEKTFTLTGRVTYAGKKNLAAAGSDGTLIVELRDVTEVDQPAKVVVRIKEHASQFPMSFRLNYSMHNVSQQNKYSLYAVVKNKHGKLLYKNHARIHVTPIGVTRSMIIDVPVVRVKRELECTRLIR